MMTNSALSAPRDTESTAEYTVRVRRALHSWPETGIDNPRTQQFIVDELSAIEGVEVRHGNRGTSVVARLRTGRPGGTALLRADTDALPVAEDSGEDFASQVPGTCHACGHDAHVAMLLGAARLLAARREELCGDILLVFQPGEEGHDGARALLADEAFADLLTPESVTQSFAIHITPNLPSGAVFSRAGTLMASTDGLAIELRGKGGHAALPQLSANPVPPLADLAFRLSSGAIHAGAGKKSEDALVTVTALSAGSTHNVIPDSGRLLFTLRCLDEASRQLSLSRIRAAAEAVGDGVSAELSSLVSYPCTVNHAEAVRTAREAVTGLPALAWQELPAPVMTAEDFSYFLEKWPGCMVLLGACPPDVVDPATAAACHSPQMRLDESVLASGAALHAAVAAAICSRR
ncbi:M20 family metallopeptidase [Streptomyces sp. NBC_00191]|uniref:M20 metallopeptidase family protein n=1 Tax=Streptomyces sp. NBC_00191 TaxID=2975674 RepID=UPI00324BAF6F